MNEKNDILKTIPNQMRVNVFCSECLSVVDAPVFEQETEIETYYGPKKIKTKYKELFAQCPFCSSYPHSSLLSSENEKRKKAAIETAAK